MSSELHSVGIIRLEPGALDRLGESCDDSTLDLLLGSFAHRSSLADSRNPRRSSVLLSTTRWFNWQGSSEGTISLRANMAQLMDDLQAEFDRAERALL